MTVSSLTDVSDGVIGVEHRIGGARKICWRSLQRQMWRFSVQKLLYSCTQRGRIYITLHIPWAIRFGIRGHNMTFPGKQLTELHGKRRTALIAGSRFRCIGYNNSRTA